MKAGSSTPDDGRRRTGYRLLFNRVTEADAWYVAKLLKRLSAQRRRQIRMLIEEFLIEDDRLDPGMRPQPQIRAGVR